MSFYPSNIARCEHIKTKGTQCGSPALRGKRFCYFHQRWRDIRIDVNDTRARLGRSLVDMPVLEDAEAVQVSLMQVMRLILGRQVEPKAAGLLLYALQTASSNLRHARIEPLETCVVIDPSTVDQTVLGEHQWCREDFVQSGQTPQSLQASAEDVNVEASAEEDSATKRQQTMMQIREMVTNAARGWGIALQSTAQLENQT